MLKTITPAEMRRVEQRVMAQTGVTSETLMNRAAARVARVASEMLRERGGLALCLCGTGNNGGDGLAAMRILAAGDEGFEGECWLMQGELSPDASRELARLQAEQPRVKVVRLDGDEPPAMERVALVIDALFGTGLSRPLEGMAARLVEHVGASGARVLAVDIPSGLNGETGELMGAAIEADTTVTFHRPKPGLYLGQGIELAGNVVVAPIGLPDEWDDADGLSVLERSDLKRLLPKRRRLSHKGSYGRVLLWVGSRGMAGAAAVAALSALRTGAGLVTVACPDEIVDIVQTFCPCATCAPLSMSDADKAWATLDTAMENASAIGAGCGLGKSGATAKLLERLLDAAHDRDIPCVVDADALNLLACKQTELTQGAFITPHPAEAARLLGTTTEAVTRDPMATARALHERYQANVILKGAASLLISGEGAAINPYGTPAMAKGGSGDALTGVLAALLAGRAAGAYQMNDLELMQVACALHGLAGEEAARRFGERGMLATDLCACLGLDYATSEPEQFAEAASPLGRAVTVTVDRKIGSEHPKHQGLIYPINYGYVQDVLANDNDWQDAYIYGINRPLEIFEGEVVAVIRRLNDAEDKWVVAQAGTRLTPAQVKEATDFQEQFYDIEIECL